MTMFFFGPRAAVWLPLCALRPSRSRVPADAIAYTAHSCT